MNNLVDQLGMVASNPWSWLVVALMGIFVIHSVVALFRCPLIHNPKELTDEDVERASATPFTPGRRFALTMIGGIILALSGLAMIAMGFSPFLSLAALAAGLIITQTEPVRLTIREAQIRVIANRDAPEMALSGAQDRLLTNYRKLVGTNAVILTAVTAGLLAF